MHIFSTYLLGTGGPGPGGTPGVGTAVCPTYMYMLAKFCVVKLKLCDSVAWGPVCSRPGYVNVLGKLIIKTYTFQN